MDSRDNYVIDSRDVLYCEIIESYSCLAGPSKSVRDPLFLPNHELEIPDLSSTGITKFTTIR
jgi:hypothetical protein